MSSQMAETIRDVKGWSIDHESLHKGKVCVVIKSEPNSKATLFHSET